MGIFGKAKLAEKPSVDVVDGLSWPFNCYPKWLYEVICRNAKADFEEVYPRNVERVGFSKWIHATPLTWETAPWSWRKVYRERAVLSVFPAIVREMNKPTWDVRWIEEYEDYHGIS